MAARFFGLADWYASSYGIEPWPPTYEPDYAEHIAQARAELGGQRFAREIIEGEGLSLDEAMEMLAPETAEEPRQIATR